MLVGHHLFERQRYGAWNSRLLLACGKRTKIDNHRLFSGGELVRQLPDGHSWHAISHAITMNGLVADIAHGRRDHGQTDGRSDLGGDRQRLFHLITENPSETNSCPSPE